MDFADSSLCRYGSRTAVRFQVQAMTDHSPFCVLSDLMIPGYVNKVPLRKTGIPVSRLWQT